MSDTLSTGAQVGIDAAYVAGAAAMQAASKGLTYLTAKATLYVRILGAEGQNDTSGASTNEDVAALKALRKNKKKRTNSALRRAGAVVTQEALFTTGAETKLTEAETAAAMMATGFVPMRVQYNPTTLRMNTVGGRITKYTAMGDQNPNAVQNTDKKTSTYLSVQLVFEDIENTDAFGVTTLFSDASPSASQLVGAGIGLATSIFTEGYSVRKQVEGLISLLMLKRTRQVIFVWNDMFFHGELLSVDANYSMFNKKGNPIKATVDMQIQQTNANATFKTDLDYWNEVMDQAFTGGLF